jgi:hypothetical protein
MLVTVAVLLAVATAASAQEVTVAVQGKILWISGTTMAIAPVDRPAVTVDLSRLDVADYATLMSGEWVVVTGTTRLGTNRVTATSIQRLSQ